MSTSQNGQTHRSNSTTFADELFECVLRFVGLALKGVIKTSDFAGHLVKKYEFSKISHKGGIDLK